MILVDTSVWVAHFRSQNEALRQALNRSLVLMHPLIIGEIACGTPPFRAELLRDMWQLRIAQPVTMMEILDFIEREKLYGLGCGIVDLSILCSAIATQGAKVWTLDKRLGALAERFGLAYQAAH